MTDDSYLAIDAVVLPYTPDAKAKGWWASSDDFRARLRVKDDNRRGVTIEDYIAKMDRARIERSLLIAHRQGDYRRKDSAAIPYEYVHEICARHPDRFSGLAGIDPFRGMEGLRELEHAVKEYGFVGAHLYPHWFELAPDAAKYYPYYAKCCELDISIMMQIGNCLVYRDDWRLPSVGRPIALDQVAIDFPELALIGIHVGWPWHDEMIAMAWKHPNVYIGLDAYAPKYWPESIVHYANSFGQDKVIFGTDWPIIDPERAMREIDKLNHFSRPEAKRKVMRDNAIRVFKLDERTAGTHT